MSRTDKTDPYVLLLWFAADRVIRHDHRDAPCDAPSSVVELLRRPDARCSVDTTAPIACNCHVCRGQWWGLANRSARRAIRRLTRDAVKAARGDDYDALVDLTGFGRRFR